MEKIYVLKLQGGFYYVGKTSSILHRIQQHLNGTASAWTKLHLIVDVEEVRPEQSPQDEDTLTKIYADKYGIDNVRGGAYCQVTLSDDDKRILQRDIWHMKGACTKCGRINHMVADCKSIEDVLGHKIDSSSISSPPLLTTSSLPSIPPVPSATAGVCQICGKGLKTINGYNKHIIKCKEKNSCKRCGRFGHLATGCVVGTDKGEIVQCYKCKEPGHYANACKK